VFTEEEHLRNVTQASGMNSSHVHKSLKSKNQHLGRSSVSVCSVLFDIYGEDLDVKKPG
jgi:hypothetical protein